MRKGLALMMGCTLAMAVSAQSITIKINGHKHRGVLVDGKNYSVDKQSDNSERTITINELLPGQHYIKVLPLQRNNTTATSFITKDGFETILTITGKGSVQVKEKALSTATSSIIAPMNDGDFTTLLHKVRNPVKNSSRLNAVTNAIAGSNNHFNTAQLRLLLESFDGETQKLTLAQQAYPTITDKINFGTLLSLFSSQDYQDALNAFIRAKGGDLSYSYSESFRIPMIASNFQSILESVETQWQEGSRLSTIIDVFDNTNHYFSTAQVVQLIKLVHDESSRLHLAKAAYSRITDPENFQQVYSLFTQAAYINNLSSYVNANGNTMPVIHNYGRTAMTDADFSAVYNNVGNHFRNSSKFKEVSSVFTNTTYYFTSYQARQLLLQVKGEGERLMLAKSAYRGITDPANFMAQMNDLFSLPTSRDELEEYITNYRD